MDFAGLGEPIPCAMDSGMNSQVQLGDVVVVMGGGSAGQIIAQCSKQKGTSKVVVLDGKFNIAENLGADLTIKLTPGRSGRSSKVSYDRNRY
jgi:L-iditol 2-dehydrogenase